MADILVVNTGNTPSSPFSTWAGAANTVASLPAVDAAGDRILFDSTCDLSAAGVDWTLPGTAANPNQLLSVTQSGGAGIGALSAGARIKSTTTTAKINGSCYVAGITFDYSSTSAGAFWFGFSANAVQYYKNCRFENTGGGGAGSGFMFGYPSSSGGAKITLENPVFKFSGTAHRVDVSSRVLIRGASIDGSGTIPTYLFALATGNGNFRGLDLLLCEASDFSNLTATTYIIGSLNNGVSALFRDIKMPTSWTPAYFVSAGIGNAGSRVEFYNLSAGSNVYRIGIRDYHFDLLDDSVVYKTSGADDGTPYSWKMTTTANCAYPSSVAVSPDILINNTTTGAAKTVTLDIVHDSVTALKDSEVWLEVEYLGASGDAKGSVIDDKTASVITTPADQTTSAASWTTTGLSNPNKQKLAVTFTPQKAGYFICRVCCAKASKVIYIDPVPVVS